MAAKNDHNASVKHMAKARARAMLEMLKQNKTLEETGAVYGCSKQRVHQLMTTYFADEYERLRK